MKQGVISKTYKCTFCGAEAGTITIAPKGVALPYEAGPAPYHGDIDDSAKARLELDYPGLFSKRVFSPRAIAAARKALKNNDARILYNRDFGLAPLYCPDCNAWYCTHHWNIRVTIEDEAGPYRDEYHYGTCPKDHQRLLFDRSR
jgi:hypothetical protein